ncbi:MAG: hypothetical protein GY913_32060 [Proteobacteria bacterium]|nr:hypothetical protein [Pseudomonadota bacterium]MCP4921556.1 hypothetical protein [Pseudomonadota bacterium]
MSTHRTTSAKMPLVILAGLFAFAFLIRTIEDLPNPGYAERTGKIPVLIEPGETGVTIQLRSRCGREIVDTFTVSEADWAFGAFERELELSDAGECVVGVRALPSSDEFEEVAIAASCHVSQKPKLAVSCS